MARFASPFFQNILSLTENCVPIPPLTTYEVDYVDPKLRQDAKAGREYIDPTTQNTLRLLNLVQRSERIPTKVNYCTGESFEAGKKYQDQLKSQRLCSKRITSYMIDYQNPHQRKTLFELNELNKDGTPAIGETSYSNDQKMECTLIQEKSELVYARSDQDDSADHYQIENEYHVPKWKREGWDAKKNCWLRPLKERQYYYETLQFKTDKKRMKKRTRCDDDD